MAMGGIQNDNVHTGLHQCLYTLQHIGGDTHCCAAEQTSLAVLGRLGIFDLFLDILDGDESLQIEVVIYDGQLLLAGFGKDLLGLFQGDALFCGDQALGGHAFLDLLGKIGLELQVTIGDDTHQLAALGDRHAGNAELGHQVVGVRQCMLRG